MGSICYFACEENMRPFMVTRTWSSASKIFLRALVSFHHLFLSAYNDPFEHNGVAFKNQRKALIMHRQLAKRVDKNYSKIEGKDKLMVSQYSVVQVLMDISIWSLSFPKESGLQSISDEEYDNLFYFFRVMGYCVGIDDRFNPFSGPRQESIALGQHIIWTEWRSFLLEEEPSFTVGVQVLNDLCGYKRYDIRNDNQ